MTNLSPEKLLPAETTVLFSGGRDSSLAACLLANYGTAVHLLTTFNGASVKGDLAKYRYEELREAFPREMKAHVIINSFSLFRRIALVNIEEDFAKYKKNLIPVGDALATHTEAIVFCLKNGISAMASGYTTYESDFPEQMPEVIDVTREFVESYKIRYLTPVLAYDNIDDVKYRLFDFGISTKSLEGTSLFADTYTLPEVAIVKDYVQSKTSICREYISLKTKTDF
jgi:7-cyano-7-deazaguanine synthase in queuosine biosynthesis